MAPRAWLVIALAGVFTAACDLKPKTPETRGVSVALPSAAITARPVAETQPRDAQEASAADEGEAERSIRLFGRGIDRQRQIRV
jgi:hypothetical protein